MGNRTSVYLDDGLQAAVKASGIPLAELIRRGLTVGTAEVTQPTMSSPASPLAVLLDGEPSAGTLCMGPGCFQRDTSRYGPPQAPPLPRLRRRPPRRDIPTGDTPERRTPHPPRRSLIL
jgi:hypothetical protein